MVGLGDGGSEYGRMLQITERLKRRDVMGEQAELKGPDLAAGVLATSIPQGGSLLGHAFGESVLLARVGNSYFAIGASCTHYGGPLAEGVIDGDTVRCPWHHACFSLRTGEALRAPALNPVACWNVEQRKGSIFVTGKVERDPLAPTYPVTTLESRHPRHVIVVGLGAAGTAAVEMLRRSGYSGDITVVDDDKGTPYDRPNLSKDYLAGNAPEEWIPIRGDDFYAQHDVKVVKARATSLNTGASRLEIEGRPALSYDALILATGAEPIRLEMLGGDLPHVHYLRSLVDSRRIIDASKTTKRAVVMGASFIGLEVAASLRARNIDVHVVAPEKLPLARALGDHLGSFIKSLHEEKGVVFHLGHTASSVERDVVVLDDGTRVPADLVVIGVGVRPRLSLAEHAGLKMEKGVLVNEFLETSAPGVYAVGDIARWPDPHTGERIRVEHWVVAQRQGQTAARNILGARERFDHVPFFWSAHYDVSINYIGHAERWDRERVDGNADKRDVAVRFERAGHLLALATLFRDDESLREEIRMERNVSGAPDAP
jgi:NADPH-dependent 2,4-dienoyl-CoA reductase/sulfur reductase-like enzyme/nitrite reductase/ring-hydroxylating ferredoxin subunit